MFQPTTRVRAHFPWLLAAMTIAAIYGGLMLQQGFATPYTIQDDARQHVFWMQRFGDPALFRGASKGGDLIADYFQAVAPAGYTALYRTAAALGLEPLVFCKLLPLPLMVIIGGLGYGIGAQLLPLPIAGFASSVLLSQSVAMTDSVASGTPRAFIYPLFAAFLYGRLRRSAWICWLALILQGLFYPQLLLICGGTLALGLLDWKTGRLGALKLTTDRQLRWLCGGGLVAAILAMLPYALIKHGFGPVISAAEARQMLEFLPKGRSSFFNDQSPEKFWFRGRAGLNLSAALTPATNLLGFGLIRSRWRGWPWSKSPLLQALSPEVAVLGQLLIASAACFFAAHALLFKLHLPSRYSGHSLRLVFCAAAGVVLVLVLERLWTGIRSAAISGQSFRRIGGAVLLSTLVSLLLFLPLAAKRFPASAYFRPESEALIDFLRLQPKESLVASLMADTAFIPSLAQRSVLVSPEYAIPYHLGYYREFSKRAAELVEAQFSSDPAVVRRFIDRYGVTHWLLDGDSFRLNVVENDRWIRSFQPATQTAIAQLKAAQLDAKRVPVVKAAIDRCSTFQLDGRIVLDANCIVPRISAP
jgi:hypothetical protein